MTITGTNLSGAGAVRFGGTAASFTPVSDTRITATAPAHAVGTVHVTVTTADGTTATSSADWFTYTPSADLSLTLTGPSTASPGSRITYTLTVRNDGPNAAESVTLSNNLPYGTQYTGVSTTQGTCTPPGKTVKTVTCDLGDIANGGSTSSGVTVKVTAKPGGGYLNDVATVSSSTFDPSAGNNSASLSTTVGK